MSFKPWTRLASGHYYVYPKPMGRLLLEVSYVPQPVTVLVGTQENITGSWIEKQVSVFAATDDVFHPEFLQTVIITHPTEVELEPAALEILEKNGMKKWQYGGAQSWHAGPYFSDGEHLYEAWKLFPDTSEAFYITTRRSSEDFSTYVPLDVSVFAPVNTVAVPSRLYFPKTNEKPLNGLRIAVKDIYDLKGVKTAGSSRSYNQLYPTRTTSASSVQKLIDLGAVIVGKTKTTTFADREIPTGDWIDTHAPFNPRGDGYLVPGGSTSGGGAALASYDWLDIAIGTDTSGSVRWPAAHEGLFGFKPTFGVLPMDGIIPSSQQFDVPAYLTRDVKSANDFARQWFGPDRFAEPKEKQPSQLLYPLDYVDPTRERTMSTNQQVLEVFEKLVQKLEAYMGVKRTIVDFSSLWIEKAPHQSTEKFDEYFLKTYEYILNYDSWHNNQQFVADYNKEFGRDPYLPPSIANRWKFGKNTTAEDRAMAVKQVDTYRAWFEENLLRPDSDGLSNAILVLPWTAGFANYRDTTKPIPNDSFGHGFWSSYITSFTTGPELVFPIGTWTYESKVTHRQERLPVSAGIVGAPGSDFGVLSFVQDFLLSSGMKDHVITGSEVFDEHSTTVDNDPNTLQSNL